MSAQMARLLGMLILIIEISVLLDLRKITIWVLRGLLVVALGKSASVCISMIEGL